MVIVALLLLFQDRIELKEHESAYLLHKPAGYAEARAWPAVVQLEPRAGKAADGVERWRDRGFLVIVPVRKEMTRDREAAFVRACLSDAKARTRVDPELVLLCGRDDGADAAVALAAAEPGLFAACAPFAPTAAPLVEGKLPPFCIVLRRSGEGVKAGQKAGSDLANSGVDVLVRTGFDPKVEDEGAVLGWFAGKARSRADLETVDRFLEARRFQDATLVCLGLLDRPEQERFVKTRLQKIEAAGIVALGGVEVAMADRKCLDAWIRCRDAAVEFSWVPVGEKLRKRLAELDRDPRVRKARGEED